MKIMVKVKTRSKIESIERIEPNQLTLLGTKDNLPVYKIQVKEAPIAGRANDAVIKLIANYFQISPVRVQLLSGQTSKQKMFDVL